jgi:hypothetical protein
VNGYAAYAHLGREGVRPVGGHALEVRNRTEAAERVSDDDAEPAARQTVGPGPLSEAIAELRLIWGQTTFFLFDGNSWR